MTRFGNPPADEPSVLLVPIDSGRPSHVHETRTIIEKRAPTDESIKLLREMEQKAEAQVIKAVQVSVQHFECVVHCTHLAMSDQIEWRAIFNLNGKQLTAEHSVWRADSKNLPKVFEGLRDAMAKVVAEEVLHRAFVETLQAAAHR